VSELQHRKHGTARSSEDCQTSKQCLVCWALQRWMARLGSTERNSEDVVVPSTPHRQLCGGGLCTWLPTGALWCWVVSAAVADTEPRAQILGANLIRTCGVTGASLEGLGDYGGYEDCSSRCRWIDTPMY